MASFNLGILDGVNGKVGTVVGYKRYGKKYMRAYVANVKNPRTKDQQLVRARFSELGKVARAFVPAINIGLAGSAAQKHQSQGNDFMERNWKAVSGDTPAEVMVDYTQLEVSYGLLPMPGFGSVRTDEALTVDVTFVPNSDVYMADSRDQVYVFVFQPDTKSGVLSSAVLRSAGSVSISVPSGWSGMRIHAYGFAVGNGAENKGLNSPSAYLGSGTIV